MAGADGLGELGVEGRGVEGRGVEGLGVEGLGVTVFDGVLGLAEGLGEN